MKVPKVRFSLQRALLVVGAAAVFLSGLRFNCCLWAEADWRLHKSSHFVLYYHSSIPGQFIRRFSDKCEYYYHSLTREIGLRRFDFWTWENRAKVYIYPTRQSYIQATGRPEASLASVQPGKKLIKTFYFSKDLFDIILPHEISHIMFKELVGFNKKVPVKTQEAFASSHEKRANL